MTQNLFTATPHPALFKRTGSGTPVGGTLRMSMIVSWLKTFKSESEIFIHYLVEDKILGAKIGVSGALAFHPLNENSSAVAMPSFAVTDTKPDVDGLPSDTLKGNTVTSGETIEFLLSELEVSRQINSRFGIADATSVDATSVKFLNGATKPTAHTDSPSQNKLQLLGHVSSVTVLENVQDGILSEIILLGINPSIR